MRLHVGLLSLLALLAIGIAAGGLAVWLLLPEPEPKVVQLPGVPIEREVDAPLPEQLIEVAELTPLEITTYVDSVRVDTQFVPVPQQLGDDYFLVSRQPLRLTPWKVELARFNPRRLHWQQLTLDVPRPSWRLAASASVGVWPYQLAEADLSLAYKNLALFGKLDAAVIDARSIVRPTVGIRYTLVDLRW